ncbi:MAG: hypothetical protein OEY01_09125 [Desulfobulbaceae bacterium]|nr:hypothetical protein [Desulfobulbaceae bacterium]HIJ79164.1 hypothetical protein [Deltaproteobacteria bacterium]
MTEQRYDFVQGFMAAINLYGENPFAGEEGRLEFESGLAVLTAHDRHGARPALPYEKYLEIPTYIRLGKNLHI